MKLLSSTKTEQPIRKLLFHPFESILFGQVDVPGTLHIWKYSKGGGLDLLSSITPSSRAEIGFTDFAISPSGSQLAIGGSDSSAELRSIPDGRLLHAYQVETADFASCSLVFSKSGLVLLIGMIHEDKNYVLRLSDGAVIGNFWGNTALAIHPCEEIVAGIYSQQLGCAIQFARFSDTGQVSCFRDVLIVPANMGKIVFSPNGRWFALVGGILPISIKLYEFVSLGRRFQIDERPIHPYQGRNSFQLARPFSTDIIFSTDSSSFFWPSPTGNLIQIRTDDWQESARWPIHAGAITAIHAKGSEGLVASAGLDGVISLWSHNFPSPLVHASGLSERDEFFQRHSSFSYDSVLYPRDEMQIVRDL